MSMCDFAESELQRAHLFDEEGDFYGGLTGTSVMELLNVLREQNHSGTSAMIVVNLFTCLAKGKPISPLTGEDDEWIEHPDELFQNKRCSAVFKKGKDGQAYYIYGKIFSDDGGETWYTNKDSRVYIEFPYVVPDKPECIFVDKEDEE